MGSFVVDLSAGYIVHTPMQSSDTLGAGQ